MTATEQEKQDVGSPVASPTRRHRNRASMDVYPFAVVVVTFPDEGAARVATQGPLRELQETYPTTKFLATCDPMGCRCGSGGGTLAALERAAQELHENDGIGIHIPSIDGNAGNNNNNDNILDATILILHAGGDSSRCFTQMALGKAWTNLPLVDDRMAGKEILSNPILLTMDSVARIFSQSHRLPRGSIVIAASDCLLSIPHYYHHHNSKNSPNEGENDGETLPSPRELGSRHASENHISPDVLGVAFPAAWETAKNHGVYVLSEVTQDDSALTVPSNQREIEVPIRRVFQKPSLETLRAQPFVKLGSNNNNKDATTTEEEEGLAWIDNGIIAFLPKAAKALHSLAQGTLKTTTKSGLEQAMKEHQEQQRSGIATKSYQDLTHKVDLYTHFLQALTITGEPGQKVSSEQHRANYLQHHASDLDETVANGIFDALSPFQFQALAVPEGKFLHLGTTRELIDFYVHGCQRRAFSSQEQEQSTTTKPTRHELYTQNCTFFGQELGLIRRMDLFVKWQREDGKTSSKNDPDVIGKNCIIMGSVLEGSLASSIGEGTVIEFCNLASATATTPCAIHIGNNCLVSGLRNLEGSSIQKFSIPNDTSMQMMPLLTEEDNTAPESSQSYVVMSLGVNDAIKKSLNESTFAGVEMPMFLKWADLTPEDLWPGANNNSQTIWNAKLHPVISSSASDVSFSSVWDWLNYLPKNSNDTVSDAAKESLQRWKALPRLSLKEVRDQSDAAKEFRYRHDLVHTLVPQKRQQHCQSIIDILWGRQHDECNFYPLLVDTLRLDKEDNTMRFLSSPAAEALRSLDDVISGAFLDKKHPDVCGRALMVQSALLAELAEAASNNRTTSSDKSLSEAITCGIQERCSVFLRAIQSHTSSGADRQKAFTEITAIRQTFVAANGGTAELRVVLQQFSDIMESIARILTEICVSGFLNDNATLNSKVERLPPVLGQWVITTSPARVDLSGGWSDTPPVCYEFGSAVTGIAVTVDKKNPLSCRCRIAMRGSSDDDDLPIILLRSELRDSMTCNLVSSIDTNIRELKDLQDARDPSASGALVKCALVCLGLISVEMLLASPTDTSVPTLQECVDTFCQTQNGHHARMEIVVTSLLPQGSGMGTSSILGGAVLAAVGRCVGIKHSTTAENVDGSSANNIIDSVSALEQILSTGGGFQDQVNGLIGGAKIVSTKAGELPIRLNIKQVEIVPATQKKLDDRLLLAFTGKTRLAANILQNVLRRFALRTHEIVDCAQSLVDGAQKAREALQEGDIDSLGTCLHEYWQQKKHMAGEDVGVEPELVHLIIDELKGKNLISGASLCGAGGGGFLVMIASPNAEKSTIHSTVQECLKKCNGDASTFSWHECQLANEGLATKILSAEEAGKITDFEASWHSC